MDNKQHAANTDANNKFKKSLQKALDMNQKIPDVQISKDKMSYKGISPYKWIIIFVGPHRYNTNIALNSHMNKDPTNINLIIIGFNITYQPLCDEYSKLCE